MAGARLSVSTPWQALDYQSLRHGNTSDRNDDVRYDVMSCSAVTKEISPTHDYCNRAYSASGVSSSVPAFPRKSWQALDCQSLRHGRHSTISLYVMAIRVTEMMTSDMTSCRVLRLPRRSPRHMTTATEPTLLPVFLHLSQRSPGSQR
ncbi:hypothetical protein DPMN_123741 [Dreissena polymorpha]|uniref:Uncharacterized protein n=1 Tax=Dreissena polymorpha TaxID=45954 RepID=A0A9D4JVH1_DREPO|nr:hypothetical protein DPMN_123741 [Dreissena polymorpha]